jgi:hypothetical protein
MTTYRLKAITTYDPKGKKTIRIGKYDWAKEDDLSIREQVMMESVKEAIERLCGRISFKSIELKVEK